MSVPTMPSRNLGLQTVKGCCRFKLRRDHWVLDPWMLRQERGVNLRMMPDYVHKTKP